MTKKPEKDEGRKNKLQRKKKEKRMKKDKIRRKNIKSRKAKKYRKKKQGKKKRKQGKGKMEKKMTWTWTSLNPPVSRRKTHPLHVRYAGDSKELSWQNWSRGFSLSFPLSFPSFPLPWRRFSPSLRPFGMTLIARMKHE